jgi:hypothetical protein
VCISSVVITNLLIYFCRAEFWEHPGRGPVEEMSVEKHTLPELAQPPTTFALQDNSSGPRNGSSWMPYPKAIEPAHDLIAPKGPQAGLYESRSTSAEERFPIPEAPPQSIVKPGDVVLRHYVPDTLPTDRISLVPAGHDKSVAPKPNQAKSHAAAKNSPQGKAPRQTTMSAALVEQLKHALSDLPTSPNDDPSTGNLERSQPNKDHSSKNMPAGPNPDASRAQDKGTTAQVLTPEGSKASHAEKKALEVIDIITKLGFTISKDPAHLPKQQNAGSAASHKSENQVTCETCLKFTGRPCELKYVHFPFEEK